jgi:hypothetical protein
MLVILEGVDGAGKTRLKDALAIKHGVRTRMLQAGPNSDDPMIKYEWTLRDYDRRDTTHLTICDTWHVQELIMGRLYRGRSMLTDPAAKHVELFLEALGALKIIITDSVGVIEHRLSERTPRQLRPEHVGMVWDFYNDWAENNPDWWLLQSAKAQARTVLREARNAQERAVRLASMPSYIGSPKPRFLVLSGYRTWSPSMPKFQAALTPTLRTERNHAILERLLPYHHFGILSQDADQIRDVWPIFDGPPVIATDPEAYAACAIAGIHAMPITQNTWREEVHIG